MPFETPITVAAAIENINEGQYVLPAIQREFVWKPEQIIRLFDSLLTGYPIGSFLFWTVKPENAKKYEFYRFIKDFHELNARHNPKASVGRGKEVTAVLDGQQRLTALYLGLTGTYAARRAKAWRNNPNAYPKQRLYLCLTRRPEDPEASFDLRFLQQSDDLYVDQAGEGWVRVGAALDWTQQRDPHRFLAKAELANDDNASEIIWQLHGAIRTQLPISFYLEKDQSLDRVLSIFVRVNSGGTKLSHSDLLLSIATSQWNDLDARETIYELVDEINRQGHGFAFDKDFVLKCCLMVADLETRFSTTNFTAANMKEIEGLWPKIDAAIRTTVNLLVGFGLSADTLMSVNAVVPIVYYVARRGNPTGFATKKEFAGERERIRQWLLAALLMRTFTGQPDSILRIVREAIRADKGKTFPAEQIVAALDRSQRPMRIEDSDLDRFLDEEYGSGYAFATLGLLYPSLDFRNLFHVDHLHPRAGFTQRAFTKLGVPAEDRSEFMDRRDAIANLQLLDGTQNLEKSKTPFGAWLKERFARKVAERQHYSETHYIPDVDPAFEHFLAFTSERRALLRAQLRKTLGLPPAARGGDVRGAGAARATGRTRK